MAKSKSVTIQLTEKQRAQIRQVTGEEHSEVKFERTALGDKTAGKRLTHKTAGKTSLMHKTAGKTSLMHKTAGKTSLGNKVAGKRFSR